MTAYADRIAAALRPLAPGSRLVRAPTDEVALIDAIAAAWEARSSSAPAGEAPWLPVARALIGTREIPGPKHEGFIAKGWARLGAPWFNSDETPWCGFFVAHCLDAAGIRIPARGEFARARAWLGWGKSCPPVLGAVAVFAREGGGHVGFLVGRSATRLYVLGGNQSNMVSIAPIATERCLGFRWPLEAARADLPLPAMSGGAVSRNEA